MVIMSESKETQKVSEEEIQKLAELSKISLSEAEKEAFTTEIGDILESVSRIREVAADEDDSPRGEPGNVLREDEKPHEPGVFTDRLLEQAPETENDRIKVSRVL